MNAPATRIAPLEPPYEPDVDEKFVKLMGGMTEVPPLTLFRTLMTNRELESRMFPLGSHILGPSSKVEPRLREVMIDRTCALTGSEYEWGVHVAGFAGALGWSDEQIASTVTGGPDDACWADDERAVMRLADELHTTNAVSDDLFTELGRHFDSDQILQLTVTAGWYHAISYVIAVARLEPEEWAARFPALAREHGQQQP
jgi:alkylhydroperoxidase family enzyme